MSLSLKENNARHTVQKRVEMILWIYSVVRRQNRALVFFYG
ncbi:MAG: hypothetical protein JWN76_1272 [Chitinophagaceae bacterium]|nr:hypothetical protein [Chitinophagaceae bacterium]